jgi:hypothetical protein
MRVRPERVGEHERVTALERHVDGLPEKLHVDIGSPARRMPLVQCRRDSRAQLQCAHRAHAAHAPSFQTRSTGDASLCVNM